MGAVREWLGAVAAVSLLLAAARFLVPKGPFREIAAFIGGLILLLALLRPLPGMKGYDLSGRFSSYQAALDQRRDALIQERETEVKKYIEARTATYISDKAESMGLRLQIHVTAEDPGTGVPVPVRVEAEGPRSETLARWIEAELAIPEERQVWNEH